MDGPTVGVSAGGKSRRSPVWWAVLAVAVCGVVATAHGLYGVAVACGVPPGVAALYVPITDGLALVAYASTDRLERAARAHAWLVVVSAAGLSGLAQAVHLAGLGEPDARLRFGVGFWPAVAVAVAAHLLWLVGRADAPAGETAEPVSPPVTVAPVALLVADETPASVSLVVAPDPDETSRETRDETPAPVRQPRRSVPAETRRSAVSGRVSRDTAKAPCDAGCGRQLSRAQVYRHRRDGCPATATA